MVWLDQRSRIRKGLKRYCVFLKETEKLADVGGRPYSGGQSSSDPLLEVCLVDFPSLPETQRIDHSLIIDKL